MKLAKFVNQQLCKLIINDDIYCLLIQACNKWKGLFTVGEEFDDEVCNVTYF